MHYLFKLTEVSNSMNEVSNSMNADFLWKEKAVILGAGISSVIGMGAYTISALDFSSQDHAFRSLVNLMYVYGAFPVGVGLGLFGVFGARLINGNEVLGPRFINTNVEGELEKKL